MEVTIIAKEICKRCKYIFVGKEGEGAFKETFNIIASDGRKLALKIYKEFENIPRIKRELDAMIKCNHNNIGKLIDVDIIETSDRKFLYTLEEFLEGGTLGERIGHKLLDKQEINDLGRIMIDVLEHLESKNLVHRDIKPDNIMYRQVGVPVLVDLGLVRDLSDTSLTQTFLRMGPGSPLFASPEQLNNEKELIDWRTDMFSLGITLFYAFFDMHPYNGGNNTTRDIIERVAQRNSINQNIIDMVESHNLSPLLKMIQPWSIKRYRTISELRSSWERL